MNRSILGIDIAKQKFDVALLRGAKFKTKVFANTRTGFEALQKWLLEHQVDCVHACLEATGAYWQDLAEWLHDAGHVVSAVNAAKVHAYGRSELSRTKTDRQDAKLIARFCQAVQPGPWQPKPIEERELFALVRRLDGLTVMLTQEQTRLDTAHPAIASDIEAHVQALERAIEALRQRIHDHIDRHPGLRAQRDLLASIPGIGEATLAQLLARWSTLAQMTSVRQWVAQTGISPRERSSGSSVRGSGRITKLGDARLRKALYFPAIVARQHNPVIRSFAERLQARGKRPLQIVVACMRKLLHIIYGVLKSGKPFNPAHALAAI